MRRKYIRILYRAFIIAGILVICAGVYLILRNLRII